MLPISKNDLSMRSTLIGVFVILIIKRAPRLKHLKVLRGYYFLFVLILLIFGKYGEEKAYYQLISSWTVS